MVFSLLFGITFPLAAYLQVPGTFAIVWKAGALTFLVPYVLRRHHNGEFAMLGVILGLCAVGDVLVEIQMELGAAAFGAAHILAILLYSRHRRIKPVFSQTLLAMSLLLFTPVIGYSLGGITTAGYAILLGAMAAMAWSSNFPRYRVGIGAVLFVLSDILLFAREGGQLPSVMAVQIAIWYSYYCGMVLIAIGIVQTLVKRGHFQDTAGL